MRFLSYGLAGLPVDRHRWNNEAHRHFIEPMS